MDPIAIILLIVVLVSVTVWVISAKKLKSRSDDYHPLDPRMESYDGEVTVMDEAVKQNTIYQNHVKNDMICCPHCDGEISKNAVQCNICGALL